MLLRNQFELLGWSICDALLLNVTLQELCLTTIPGNATYILYRGSVWVSSEFWPWDEANDFYRQQNSTKRQNLHKCGLAPQSTDAGFRR